MKDTGTANAGVPADQIAEETATTAPISLDSFLNLPDVKDLTEEIKLQRLGALTISAMTSTQHKDYQKACTRTFVKGAKKGTVDFDMGKFELMIASNHIISPDFSNANFLSKVGFTDAADFIKRKFKPGEIQDIYKAVSELSGFDADIDEDVETAKN